MNEQDNLDWDDDTDNPVYEPKDKWSALEKDLTDAIGPVLEKHQEAFGSDSYAVIDAMYEVLDGMFQRVNK